MYTNGEADLPLDGLLTQAAERWGERPLLLTENRTLTYQQFLCCSHSLAGGLAELGVRRGDRVAVILPNVPEMLCSWFALARLGAVMVPLHPAFVPAEVEPLLRRVGVRGLISDDFHMAHHTEHLEFPVRVLVGPNGAGLPGITHFQQLLMAGRPAPPAAGRGSDVTTLLHTSGTTGLPKGAALSQTGYVLPALEFRRWMEVTPEDRFLGCLPLFHMAGGAFAMSAVASGSALALVDKFSAHRFWSQVRRFGVTIVRHLGEMLAVLCKLPASADDRRHSLRAVYGGGARADVASTFEQRFGVTVVEGYGLSETNTVLCNALNRRRRGSIGCPLPYAQVRIADDQGRRLPVGERGEIQVERNPVMMEGYFGDPELTHNAFIDGWFRTGDLGYQDAEGFFYFVGRKKDLIRRRGEMISPVEIERVLDNHPAVQCSAVIGVPDDVGGEELKSFVIWKPGYGSSVEELVAHCHAYLAEFKIPRYFEVCSELPRTATNKINKSRLRELPAGSLGVTVDRKAEDLQTTFQEAPAYGY